MFLETHLFWQVTFKGTAEKTIFYLFTFTFRAYTLPESNEIVMIFNSI